MRREAPFPSRRALRFAALAVAAVAALWVLLSLWSQVRLDRARERLATTVDRSATAAPREPATSPLQADTVRWLVEGTAALSVAEAESARLQEIAQREPATWSREDRELVAALARREAEALALLERVGSPQGPPAAALDDRYELEPDTRLLRGAELLLARAGLAMGDGPIDAGRTLSALAGIARALAADPGAMHQVFANGVEALFLRGVRWMAEDPEVPSAVLADLLDSLPTTPWSARMRPMVAAWNAAAPDRPPRGWTRLAPWYDRLCTASALERLHRTVEGSGDPGAVLALAGGPAAPTSPAVSAFSALPVLPAGPPSGEALATLAASDLVEIALEMQAVEASRILARAVLGLRLQAAIGRGSSDPETWIDRRLDQTAPDPLAGGRPAVAAGQDGAVMVSNRAAAAAWDERWDGSSSPLGRPPFVWRLPREIF